MLYYSNVNKYSNTNKTMQLTLAHDVIHKSYTNRNIFTVYNCKCYTAMLAAAAAAVVVVVVVVVVVITIII
jgi:hypothetical protein